MPSTLNLDFETYSEVDIKKVGTHRYAVDPSTEVLMCAYQIDNGEIYLWDNTVEAIPFDLAGALATPRYRIHAFHAQFERLILKHVLKQDIPIERFRCTMVHAYSRSFAGKMAQIAKAVGVPEDKQKLKIGEKLINRFCSPAPKNHKADRYTKETHPKEWEQFKEYCIGDVVAEQAILEYLQEYPMRVEDWRDWWLDQKINDRGVPVDLDLIEAAIALNERHREQLLTQMSELTGLDNPNSREQLLEWLRAEYPTIENLQAATVQTLLDGELDSNTRQVLEMKQQISKSSIAKYEAAKRAQWGGRIYGPLQFMGASRTGRWSGRVVQLQNVPRGPNTLSQKDAIGFIKDAHSNR